MMTSADRKNSSIQRKILVFSNALSAILFDPHLNNQSCLRTLFQLTVVRFSLYFSSKPEKLLAFPRLSKLYDDVILRFTFLQAPLHSLISLMIFVRRYQQQNLCRLHPKQMIDVFHMVLMLGRQVVFRHLSDRPVSQMYC